MYKIILYGIGRYLELYINQLISSSHTFVVGISDSNPHLWGSMKHGYIIRDFFTIGEDYDYVVISSTYANEIEKYLVVNGVNPQKIKRLKEYMGKISLENWKVYYPASDSNRKMKNEKKYSVAAITPVAAFNGACLAVMYLLAELAQKGYIVGLVAPEGDNEFIQYALRYNIEICIYPNIEFTRYKNWEWIHQFDKVIVNTLLVHRCIVNLKHKDVLWWIHESELAYLEEIKLWGDFDEKAYEGVPIYCVSELAIHTFRKYFPHLPAKRLEYGIPDFYRGDIQKKQGNMIFAIIGYLYPGKGQDILLQAIRQVKKELLAECEFWIIGKIFKDDYCNDLKKKSSGYPIKFLGEMSHEKIEMLYPHIDVVISASRQDTLSIVITEALMNKKLAVMSSAIGMCAYVKNGENSFVFKNGESKELAGIIEHILRDKTGFWNMRKAGRKVYEDVFSMESFQVRLRSIFIL